MKKCLSSFHHKLKQILEKKAQKKRGGNTNPSAQLRSSSATLQGIHIRTTYSKYMHYLRDQADTGKPHLVSINVCKACRIRIY